MARGERLAPFCNALFTSMPASAQPARAPDPATVPITSPVPSQAPTIDARWQEVEALPCSVTVEVEVSGFTVKNLLALNVGSVIGSRQATTSSLPLRVNGELIAWCDFEAMGKRLSVRLAELA
jgi:flagellar motor switch/type III secretory pathway protein FliN